MATLKPDFDFGFKSKYYLCVNNYGEFCIYKVKGNASYYWDHVNNKWAEDDAYNAWHCHLPSLLMKFRKTHKPGKQFISLGMTQHFDCIKI